MTGPLFHSWVQNPSLLDKNSLAQLQEITKRFPYFQSAQLLLAKNLKALNHIDQRRQLHIAAVYASDRTLLFGLMNETHPPIAEEKSESQRDVVLIQNRETEPPIPETPVILPITEEVNPIEIEIDEHIEKIATTEQTEENHIARQNLYDLIPEPLLYRIEDAELPPLETEEELDDIGVELSFDQWLAKLESSKIGLVKSKKKQIPESESTSNLKDNLALINDFLVAQAKEGKPQRTEFFKPSKAAERSNQSDFSVVSETLASIYEQQGKFELAFKSFEALELKYPEKSSYFAARKKIALEKLNALG
jgi:hypothetical protein